MASFNWTDNANVIPTIIARECIENAKAYMNLAKRCRRNFENEIQKEGDKVTIPKFAKPAVQEKTAGTPISTRIGTSTTTVDVALEKHFIVPLTIEDTGKYLSKPDAFAEIMKSAGIAMAEKIETYIFNKVVAHGALSANYRLGTFGTTIDKALVMDIKEKMGKAKIPPAYPRYCTLGSEGIMDIFGISEFTQVLNIGRTQELGPLSSGTLPPIMGIYFDENQLEPVTEGSPNQRSGIAFVEPSIALVCRPLDTDGRAYGVAQDTYMDEDTNLSIRVTMQYDSNNVGVNVNIECLVGAKIIIPEWCWEIRH